MALPDTLPQMLSSSVERDPASTVYLDREGARTYGELQARSRALASGLLQAGLRRGDRVALVLGNSFAYLTAYYGVLQAGAVVIPHPADARTESLTYVLRHSAARAVLLEGRALALLDGQAGQLPELRLAISVGRTRPLADAGSLAVLAFDELLASGEGEGQQRLAGAAPNSSEELASIVYTSGTTGRPKGVMLTHGNLLSNTRSIVQYLGLTAADRVGLVLPFFYVYGNSVLQTHVCAGGSIAELGSMAFPAAVLAGLSAHRCTGLSGVPSTFARLLQFSGLAEHDLCALRYITQAGGPMPPALTQRLCAALPGAQVFVMYGQTEAAARLSYLPPADLWRKMGSAGQAIPGVELRIMDAAGEELPPGEVGEIVARGPNIMAGYWQDPEETARVLRPDGLHTGDLARMDEDGFLFIVGRESEIIKSGAHRIGPQEIEEVVARLPAVAECGVTGVPDELLGEAIVVFVVPVSGQQVTAREVLRICHEHLPRYKLPAQVRVVDALPRTPSGKVRRKDLRLLLLEPAP